MKVHYGETSITRLRQLTLKFNGYKKHQNHTMRQHLTVMSNMISELKAVRHEMTDEQQVQVVIRFLPSNWEHMRVNLTHNDNIKTFDDVAHHVELEEYRLLAEKPIYEAFITENKSREAQDFVRNKRKGKGPQGKRGNESNYSEQKRKRGNHTGMKSKNKNNFSCGKLDHFTRECTKSKVMFDHNSPSNTYVSSCLMLDETIHFWTIDSAATDHAAKDRTSFVEFR